jgi:hypothetical protein
VYILPQGHETSLLDIVEVDVTGACPGQHQPENWMLGNAPWTLAGQVPLTTAYGTLAQWLSTEPLLFGSAGDRIPYSTFTQASAAASLVLIEPSSIEFEILSWQGKQKTRGIFRLQSGALYNLSITDANFRQQLKTYAVGRYTREDLGIAATDHVLLTVSLGEPLPRDGCCYKLIAAVLVLP